MKTIRMALAVIFVSQFYMVTDATADTNSLTGSANTVINNTNETVITIQVSSFRRMKGAAQAVSTLKRHGVEAFSRYEAVSGKGMWHRVYIGRFGTRQDAKKMASKLKAQGIISTYWIKALERPKTLVGDSMQVPSHTVEVKQHLPSGKKVPKIHESKSDESYVGQPDKTTHQATQSIARGESTTSIEAPEIESKNLLEFPQQTSTPVREVEKSWFSIAIKTGPVFSPHADNFLITKSTDGVQYTWQFSKRKIEADLVPSFRLTESFFVEGRLQRTFATELDLWYLTIGPKMKLASSKSFSPYLRGGVTWGDLSWDEIPGDFDNSFGWELGLGLDIIRTRYKVGIEAWHRSIQFDYNAPLHVGVTSSQNSIDLSGYVLTGSLIFFF